MSKLKRRSLRAKPLKGKSHESGRNGALAEAAFFGSKPNPIDVFHSGLASRRAKELSESQASRIINLFNARKKTLYKNTETREPEVQIRRLQGELELNSWFFGKTGISLLAPRTIAQKEENILALKVILRTKKK